MPEKVIIDVELLMPKQLEKDLMEHQQVCVTCKGLGVVVRDNEYGLKGEVWIRGFPHKNQSLWPCPDCYNGVQPVCKYCGKPGSRGYTRAEANCQCEGASNARSKERDQKEQERWDKAEKVSPKEACNRFELVYIDGPDEYIPPQELLDRLEELKEEDPELPPPYIWGTYTMRIALPCATDLVAEACEELHEEAESNISKEDIDRLQSLLSQWAEEVEGATTTYFPDYKYGIVLGSV